jgi:hypothetical protein
MLNYYEILDIQRNTSQTAIIKAGKRLIAETKVTSGKGDELPSQKLALIDSIMEVLTSTESRAQYDEDLDNFLKSEEKKKDDRIDYSKYLLESSDSWTSLLPEEIINPVEKACYLFDLIVELPNSDVTRPLMLAFLLTPSAMSTCLPVAFCWGKSGVGKSQPPKFAAALWGNTMLLSNSTYAGIRNQIQKDRWHDPTVSRGERNYILAWDDVDYSRLTGENGIYTMLKGGYSRSSSRITMAGKDGENICFDVFGSRIFSSIIPFFGDSKLSELKRRMLIFPMVRANRPITDFDEISWGGLVTLTAEIWRDKDNLERFVTAKRSLRGHFKSLGSLCRLSVDRQNLFIDVLSTGVSLNLFPSTAAAVEAINTHEERMSKLAEKEQDALLQVLGLFIEEERIALIGSGSKCRIRPDKLKEYVTVKVRCGELDGFPRRGEIPATMRQLGFSLNTDLGAWEPSED